ncbi:MULTISPECIES: hypothetical protein [unclassified Methylobacterium]|nr:MULTISPECIES: hypothetical protein [unclassified Methylobacterium]
MNASFVVAFVVTPALVLALGWTAVFLHERAQRRTAGRVSGD